MPRQQQQRRDTSASSNLQLNRNRASQAHLLGVPPSVVLLAPRHNLNLQPVRTCTSTTPPPATQVTANARCLGWFHVPEATSLKSSAKTDTTRNPPGETGQQPKHAASTCAPPGKSCTGLQRTANSQVIFPVRKKARVRPSALCWCALSVALIACRSVAPFLLRFKIGNFLKTLRVRFDFY